MPRRRRVSKGRVRLTTVDILILRMGSKAELAFRYGGEEMALAWWRAWRTSMLSRGFPETPLPWNWNKPGPFVPERLMRMPPGGGPPKR